MAFPGYTQIVFVVLSVDCLKIGTAAVVPSEVHVVGVLVTMGLLVLVGNEYTISRWTLGGAGDGVRIVAPSSFNSREQTRFKTS